MENKKKLEKETVLYSDDKREFIKIKNKQNKLFYSAELLLHIFDSSSQLYLGYVGDVNLLRVDSGAHDQFLGVIIINDGEELDGTKHFDVNKKVLLERIIIVDSIDDDLLHKRNEADKSFLEIFEYSYFDISENLSRAEDFYQIMLLEKSHDLSLENPLILLKKITENELISPKIKREAKNLMEAETKFSIRNQFFPKFNLSIKLNLPDLFEKLQSTCRKGIEWHKYTLLNKCPNTSFNLACLIASINKLPRIKFFYIHLNDIALFTDLIELTKDIDYLGKKIISVSFVENIWNKFFKKIEESDAIESIKSFLPVTRPNYYFLLKTLHHVFMEIKRSKGCSSPDELISIKEGYNFNADSIQWRSKSLNHKSLEQQYRLITKLVKQFEPGSYTPQNKFTYSFKLLKEKDNFSKKKLANPLDNEHDFLYEIEERQTWLYMVDCAVAPILSVTSNARFKKLCLPVLSRFVIFLQESEGGRQESFREATQNIIKFIAQTYPYFSVASSSLTDIDNSILKKQIEMMKNVLHSDNSDTLLNHFSSLLNIYNEYWKQRDSIVGKLTIPCSFFKSDVELIMQKLLEIVQKIFLKEFGDQLMIKFLRMYNEFLKYLKGVNFTWYISETVYFKGLVRVVEEVTEKNIILYKVKDAEGFVEILRKKKMRIPKHFLIEAVKLLLEIIKMVFSKTDWNYEECLRAVGDLLLAIGHTLTHFEDQADYTDLEKFLKGCTLPFQSVVENSKDYSEFKKCLGSVENFYLNSRKQNQIKLQEALDCCEKEVKDAAEKNGFKTKIDKKLLEMCYNLYSKKLISLENSKQLDILNELKKELKNLKLPLQKWNLKFKQNVLPVLLAYLSSIWSLRESRDVKSINKRIEPHSVQIVSILRLLGVDQTDTGVPKHFIQVLTGQGKSLILGLVAALIALTGNKAVIVCYSDYLAKRDQKEFDPFFSIFDQFDLKSNISYNTFDDMAFNTLHRKVNGVEKSLSSIANDFILDKLNYKAEEIKRDFTNSVLLFDEADVFFSEDFYGKNYNFCTNVNVESLLQIQPEIWKIVEKGTTEEDEALKKIREFIIEKIKNGKFKDFKELSKSITNLFQNHLKIMVQDAIFVSKNKSVKVIEETYKINKDGFICYRDSSLKFYKNICINYQNAFIYFRLKKENYEHKNYCNFGYLLVDVGSISYATLPSKYENILGVSGTLLTLSDSEQKAMKQYGIQTMSAMPSFFGERQLVFDPSKDVSILDTPDSWLSFISERISKNAQNRNRAVIVFFKSDTEIHMFEEKYRNNINRLFALTGNEDPEALEWRVNEAGVAQTVILATRNMGRGVDYKSNDRSVEEKGGIHVIQTFFSLDEKEETQIKGRTARKDNKGSYELILCREHLKVLNCSTTNTGRLINTYAELSSARQEIINDNKNSVKYSIRKSQRKHKMTLEFFESLSNYTPKNRKEILSKFPFV